MAASRIHASVDVGLRPWEMADAEELAAMYAASATELAVEEPWCGPDFLTAAGQGERIRRCLVDEATEGFVVTISGAIAGHLSLDRIRRDILQSADIGYWVAPRARRHGVATRAIGLAVAHAFDRLGLHRIHATTDLDNAASCRALEANGFRRVGVIHDFALVGGRWRDGRLFQLTADDWRSLSGGRLRARGGAGPGDLSHSLQHANSSDHPNRSAGSDAGHPSDLQREAQPGGPRAGHSRRGL